MVLQRFFGVINVLYSTTAVQRTILSTSKVLYNQRHHCWCCLAPFLLKKYNAIWHLLWFYIAPFDKDAVKHLKDTVLYSTKSGFPMNTSQEPLLVLYSTNFWWYQTKWSQTTDNAKKNTTKIVPNRITPHITQVPLPRAEMSELCLFCIIRLIEYISWVHLTWLHDELQGMEGECQMRAGM